jgi:hypothetical protein
MGDLMGATQVAAAGLAPGQHGLLASFLHLMGGVPGAHLALLGLSGLSLEMEADLCMATGVCMWRQAPKLGHGSTARHNTVPAAELHAMLDLFSTGLV